MNANTYQRRALTTERTPEFVGGDYVVDLSRLLHAQLGIASEGGELADAIKRHVIYGQPIDETNVKEELGDLLWYVALGAKAAGYTLEEVMEANLRKLEARYAGKFSQHAATERDLEKERAALETVPHPDGFPGSDYEEK